MNMNFNFFGKPNDGNPIALACPFFENNGLVRHGFSTRLGGVSEDAYFSLNLGLNTKDSRENVVENYRRFCEQIGTDYEKLVLTRQVHGTNIKTVTKEDAGKGLVRVSDLGEFDGLITDEPGLPIGVFYADCTPILMLDPKHKVIAAVHSGWKGTLGRIGRKAVQEVRRNFGTDPKDILVAFGPSIKACHFEVGEDVFSMFCQNFGTRALYGSLQKGEKFYVNTDKLNRAQLMEEGVREENIFISNACTYCHNDTFYSHRADGGKTGRMCAVIELVK